MKDFDSIIPSSKDRGNGNKSFWLEILVIVFILKSIYDEIVFTLL
jgi:hypothetical protein